MTSNLLFFYNCQVLVFYLFVYLFIYLFIYVFIYLSIYLFSAELDGVYKTESGQFYYNQQPRVYQYKLTI